MTIPLGPESAHAQVIRFPTVTTDELLAIRAVLGKAVEAGVIERWTQKGYDQFSVWVRGSEIRMTAPQAAGFAYALQLLT